MFGNAVKRKTAGERNREGSSQEVRRIVSSRVERTSGLDMFNDLMMKQQLSFSQSTDLLSSFHLCTFPVKH